MKHLKSSLRDLRDLFSRSIPVRYIAEPIASFEDGSPSSVIHSFMAEHEFDVVGVRRGGSVVGYARISDLTNGNLGDHIVDFLPSDVIDETAPMIEAFAFMRRSPQIFVRTIGPVGGIITRGDLQKTPVRMWLFGLISLIEMQLLRIIREGYPGDTWKQYLSKQRVFLAQNLLTERQRRNEAIDLADCLQFCDKRDIVTKSVKLRTGIDLLTKARSKALLEYLETLRNRLAHAQDIIAGQWPEIIDLAEQGERLLQRCEEVAISP